MDFLSGHYTTIKALHVFAAVVSITLFVYRFALLQRGSPLLRSRWIRVLPHVNDTALLVLAVLLCLIVRQAPGVTPWLTEKVVLVVLYILAAYVALKRVKGRSAQLAWFIVAVGLFAMTARIAVIKTPLVVHGLLT